MGENPRNILAGSTYREVLDTPAPRDIDSRLDFEEFTVVAEGLVSVMADVSRTEEQRHKAISALAKISAIHPDLLKRYETTTEVN